MVLLFGGWLAAPPRAAGAQRLHNDVGAVVATLQPQGRLNGARHLRLAISLPLRNQQALSDFLVQLQDPASPNYHKYLTPAQFARQFGPTEQDYDAVAAFAQAHGLRVTAKHTNRVILDVDGAVSDIEKALHVTMRSYRHPREPRQFYAADTDPTPDVTVPLLGIEGLNNYELPHPNYHIETAAGQASVAGNSGSGPSGSYAGYDFRTAYAPGVTLTGSGQTVGLLEFDGYTPSDITYYENRAGLPLVTPTNEYLDGYTGTLEGGQVEVSLDIEVAIAMAPGMSKLIVYEAGEGGSWYDMLTQMAEDNKAKQISCSWYIPNGTENPTADAIFQQMAAQGQSFFAAVGDSDAYTGLIPFPCDTPYITQVGGTTLTTSGTGSAPYLSETVWNRNNGAGTGGGISTQYAIPTWQQGISMTANLGSTVMRNVPDVALTAENVYVRVGGVDEPVGGTSCAAPLWAAFTALINQQAAVNGRTTVGFINPAIYAIGKGSAVVYNSEFHDTTAGNNFRTGSTTMFPAETGYDLCTGWGSPKGSALINALAGPLAPTITTGSGLPIGIVGAAYSQALTATGGVAPYAWSISAGSLPAGLGLSGGGVIAGTPAAPGSASFTVRVTGSNGASSTAPFNLTIYAQGTPIIATGSPLATGTVGAAYAQPFAASGGATPYTWSIASGNPPAGLSLSSGGLLSGTPTATGSSAFTVQVTGSDGLASTAPFAMTVNPPAPVITSALSVTGTVGVPVSYQIAAANSPTSYSASGLPAGLAVNPATGVISGAATSTGTSNVTISAINIGGTGSATLMIVVAPDQISYFTMSNIGSPEIAGAPIGVSITAYDVNNIIITAYSGTLSLTASGASGTLPITPASASGFVNGVWSGTVTVQAFDTNVILTANDGAGHTVASNSFTVGTGPLDHFAWSAISSPQQPQAPFAVTITAQDAGNNTVASYSGTATLSCSSGGFQIGISPAGTGAFTSGVWSGNVTLAQTGTGVVLEASNGVVDLYVADSYNSTIRKVTTGGVVTTLAGSPLVQGSADGTGSAALFSHPYGIAVDGTGAVYLADTANCTIRKITPSGVVTTLAGSPGVTGTNDGTGSAARFYYPYGLAVDGSGNIFIVDTYNDTMRKMTPDGVVTTIGGTPGVTGTQGGVGSAARFNLPTDDVVSPNGTIYVSDCSNHRLLTGVPAGGQYTWSNFVGTPGVEGGTDGTGSGALFTYPEGVALDGSGNVIVVSNSDTVRRVTPGGVVTTLAGVSGATGSANGTGSAARFNQPAGVGLDLSGNGYVVDSANGTIREVTPSGVVTTVAGTALVYGTANGTGSAAQFHYPNGGATDGGGNAGYSNAFNVTAIPSMTVSPAGGLSASGGAGGPFTPAAATYTISNVGSGSMSWSVSGTSGWLTFAPAGGTIASGSSATSLVTINGTANTLGLGTYGDTMAFTNATNGLGNITLPVTLTVLQPVPVITSALSVTGTSGVALTYQITASNNPGGYNATGLPAGLSINTATGLISGTIAASGTFGAGISASNATGTGTAALLITVQATFAAWQNQWFTPAQLADPTISGGTAAPAGDGIPNLLKYALNLAPFADGASGLPVGSVMTIGGSNYLTLTYTQVFAADITYIPEVTGDLQTWNSGLPFVAPVSATPNGDGVTETVIMRDVTPVGGTPQFMRLQVTKP